MKYGLRFSIFQNIGPGTIYNFDENFDKIDSTLYPKGEIFNTYMGLEPRFGISYLINEKSSIKANYSRTRQYMQLAQNSTAGTPLDIWFPASPNVQPQIADQVALGYFRNFNENALEASFEIYYKNMKNAIDFKDFAHGFLNYQIEHHLFPNMPHSYYQKMQPIVKDICKKHNLEYRQESVWKRMLMSIDLMVGKTKLLRVDGI